MNKKYSTLALRSLLIYFALKLLYGLYYLGLEPLGRISGFRSISSVYHFNSIDTVFILIFVAGIVFTITALIKKEKITLKFGFTILIFLYFTIGWCVNIYKLNKLNNDSEEKQSVLVKNYPKEINQIVKDSILLKDNRFVEIDVFHSYIYSTTTSGGVTTKTEGIDSTMYSIRAKVYGFDSVLIPNESYMVGINENLNYEYKMSYAVETSYVKPKWSKEILVANIKWVFGFSE